MTHYHCDEDYPLFGAAERELLLPIGDGRQPRKGNQVN
jgi:hypothetical protein